MKADYHLHTSFSDDSIYDMEQCVLDAIEKGINEICFTDHIDYGIKLEWNEDGVTKRPGRDGGPIRHLNYDEYFAKIEELKNKYKDRITIRKGLEFGVQVHTIDKYERLYEKYPMDFVILSIHQVNDCEFYEKEYFEGLSQREYNRKHYQELLDVIKKYKHYSIVGHLDSFNRYDPQGICPFEEYKDLVEEILKIVIEDGKGIELNTSNVRYKLDILTPRKEILEMYYRMGGRIITIGSDSHSKDQLYFNIDEARETLKKIGFTEFCTFDNMKPIFHKL